MYGRCWCIYRPELPGYCRDRLKHNYRRRQAYASTPDGPAAPWVVECRISNTLACYQFEDNVIVTVFRFWRSWNLVLWLGFFSFTSSSFFSDALSHVCSLQPVRGHPFLVVLHWHCPWALGCWIFKYIYTYVTPLVIVVFPGLLRVLYSFASGSGFCNSTGLCKLWERSSYNIKVRSTQLYIVCV